ncbi:hypothetical protein F503_05226 [Ophiostoma piceae UAMH 11346]|uniref:Uncharacterized protein n=1 Tax=Ophiostoma piceae (strain UAMH 11346) TaxID=1262450 RepID=S3CDN8_OPHP1|nr:hypothetical protein F503_05226 [Ophiostoma piceae UAMH 11346]
MRFSVLSVLALVPFVAAATSADNIKDLQTCLDYADSIPNAHAAAGYEAGCQITFNASVTDSGPIDALSFSKRGESLIEKRCKDEHGYCCCNTFCLGETTCPVCISGCITSCVAQYGSDCTASEGCYGC